MPIHLLSAGAAKGIVSQLFPDPNVVDGRFASAMATFDAVVAENTCDVVILPAGTMAKLQEAGAVLEDTVRPLGTVQTVVAVIEGASKPSVGDSGRLRAAFSGAGAIYLPDLARSTAGSHIAAVLDALGLTDAVAGKIRSYPNGETALAAMAAAGQPDAIGCAQATEVFATPGLAVAGPLPAEHALSTTYVAAVACRTADPEAARRVVFTLTDPAAATLRHAAGFSDPA